MLGSRLVARLTDNDSTLSFRDLIPAPGQSFLPVVCNFEHPLHPVPEDPSEIVKQKVDKSGLGYPLVSVAGALDVWGRREVEGKGGKKEKGDVELTPKLRLHPTPK